MKLSLQSAYGTAGFSALRKFTMTIKMQQFEMQTEMFQRQNQIE